MCDVLGIEFVGFGESACGTGKLADSGRVGDDQRESCLTGGTDEVAFQTAGGFDDDSGGMVAFELFDELPNGGGVVGTLDPFT